MRTESDGDCTLAESCHCFQYCCRGDCCSDACDGQRIDVDTAAGGADCLDNDRRRMTPSLMAMSRTSR